MNESYTQVSISQINDLTSSMTTAERSCSSALSAFTEVMRSLMDSGKIEGTAVNALQNNMQKIQALESDFEAYCENVKTTLKNIISEEEDIEAEASKEYDELLSINPEDFAG